MDANARQMHKLILNKINVIEKKIILPPIAGKTCSKPIVVDETTITGNSYLYEDQVTLTCPNGKQYTLKCNKDGVWEGHKDTSC